MQNGGKERFPRYTTTKYTQQNNNTIDTGNTNTNNQDNIISNKNDTTDNKINDTPTINNTQNNIKLNSNKKSP